MKRRTSLARKLTVTAAAWTAAALIATLLSTAAASAAPARQGVKKAAQVLAGQVPPISVGRFGPVTVYKPAVPTRAVLFLSGDGGWNAGVIDMARRLYQKDFLVIGIDLPRYFTNAAKGKEGCLYPPAELQALAQVVQRKLGIRRYLKPLLVGYSSGASLAYAALAAAPPGTFEGAVSLGFCPDIDAKKPLCRGDGLETKLRPLQKNGKSDGYDMLPFKNLSDPWIALHGRSDLVCDYRQAVAYAKAAGGRAVVLDKVGHGFGNKKRWQLAFDLAVRDVSAAAFNHPPQINTPAPEHSPGEGHAAASLAEADLPLVEVKAEEEKRSTPYLAVLLSGDGGWAGLDRDVAAGLSDAGVPVIGLDSLQYFWREKTPAGASADLQRILSYYLALWHKQKAIILGYSFGAEVLPFMVSRLSPELRAKIPLVALISPSAKASFEFQVGDWFGAGDDEGLDVAPELAKLTILHRLCFYGRDDTSALCSRLPLGVKQVKLEGGHRLGDSSDAIAEEVLRALGLPAASGD